MLNKIKILGSLALLYASQACANDFQSPVYIGNQNPFVMIYGLPKAEAGFITSKGQLDAAFLYYVSNNAYSDDPGNGETMIWDGETAQYIVKLRYGLFERLEIGMDLPYVQHSGGYLDSIIRNFHSMFGFPNDRQEEFEKNQINYNVSDSTTGESYSMDSSQHGLGDIRFTAAVPVFAPNPENRRHLAVRSQLKLPTGDSEYLLGSGATDVSLGLTYSDFASLDFMRVAIHANLGMLYMGDSDVLPSKHENYAGYGGLGLGWLPWEWIEFKIQMDVHSAMYDSELVQLGHSLQLLAGGTLHLYGNTYLDLGISEQLSTDATPDYGMYLILGHRF